MERKTADQKELERKAFLLHFGRRIRAARILKGYTLAECAEETGITPANLSRMERGKRSMYVENIPRLAQVLGVAVEYLLLGDAAYLDDPKEPSDVA